MELIAMELIVQTGITERIRRFEKNERGRNSLKCNEGGGR